MADPNNFNKDLDSGKNYTDPDPRKKDSVPGKSQKIDLKNYHIPCFVCLYYLTITFL